MKSLKRLFGRKSTRKFKRRLPFRISRPIGYASHVERLEDRTLLASNILASLDSSVNQPNDSTELLLTVGPGSTPTLGFEVHGTSGSFDPAAVQILDANTNAVIPLNLAENNHGGTTDSLTLATLAPGEYSIFVSGQTAATGNFTIDIFMPGDSDGSGSVSDTEYQYALAASYQNLFGFNHYTSQLIQSMGLDPTKNYYSEEQDSDKDGDIDNHDLEMMNNNRNVPPLQLELIGDQDAPAVVAGLLIDSGVSNSDGITNDLTIVGNVSDESLITQFQVALDGGGFVDIFGQLSGGASGGTFTLTRSWLETNLNGGSSLEGGVHTLHFMTADEHGNVSAPGDFDVSFELDVTAPTVASSISNQTLNEDFGSTNLGPFTDFFNQNGGTPLNYQVDSITNAVVNFDFSTDELILTSRQDVYGSADIVIQAIDAAGNAVLSNTFTVTVNAINDPPVAVDDNLATHEDIGFDYLAPGILTNDMDVENDPLTVTELNGSAGNVGNEITIGAGGKLTINSTGAMSFDPDGAYEYLAVGETTTETFTYTVSDGNGGTDTATVTITIIGVNDPPVAENDDFTITEDETLHMNFHSVFNSNGNGADYDPDTSDSIEVTAVNGSAAAVGNEVVLASGASLTLYSSGAVTYQPNGAFDYLAVGDTATETFTYTISDGNGGTDTATVTITINGVNDDPVPVDDAFSTDEDTLLTGGNVLAANPTDPDFDAEGQTLTVTEVNGASGDVGSQITLPSGALLTLNSDGTFDYDPNGQYESLAVGETTTDSFTYKVGDTQGGTDTATVTVTINGVNDDPIAVDDTFTTDEDTSTSGDLFVNNGSGADSDPDTSDSFSVSEVNGVSASVGNQITLASGALLTVNADGTVSYDPNGAFEYLADGEGGSDSFTYTIDDGNGGTSTATVTLNITGVNDAPVAVDDALTTDEDSLLSANALAANPTTADSDAESQPLNVIAVSGGSVGSQFALASGALLLVDPGGAITYDPNGAFEYLANGETDTDSFTYTIQDSQGKTDTATVTITITGVNDDPVAEDDAFTTDEDTVLSGGNVLVANPTTADSDVEGQTLTVTGVGGGSVGSQFALGSGALLTLNADGTFDYDPNGSFEYLANGQTGSDTFTYQISDSQGGTDTATATITITGVNDAPVAVDDALTTDEDSPLSANVLSANPTTPDSDVEAQLITITEVNGASGDVGSQITLPSGALLTLNSNGNFDYDPNGQYESLAVGEMMTDSFTYKVADTQGGTDTATVTVTITGVNDDPTAEDDDFTTDEDTVLTGGNVLANNGSGADSDPDTSDNLTVSEVNGVAGDVGNQISLTSGALLTLNADGTFSYDPNGIFDYLAAGESNMDSFTYTIDDGHGGTDVAVVTIHIDGVNDDPTAEDDAFSINEDTTIAGGDLFADNGSGADSDPDTSDNPLVSLVNGSAGNVGSQFTLASGALLLVNSDGTFNYDPNGVFNYLALTESATDSFTYTIDDGHGGTDAATVTVTITGLNDDPIAQDDLLETDEHTAVSGSLFVDNGSGVDSDPDTSDSFTITAINGNAGLVGTEITAGGIKLTVNADGTFSFDPNEAFAGLNLGEGESYTDSLFLNYTITDSQGATSTATVSLKINGVNDPPTAIDDALTTDEDTILNGSVFVANPTTADSDPDATDTIAVSAVNGVAGDVGTQVTLSSGALLTLSANGDVSYDPNGVFNYLAVGESATETFTYTIDDGHGLTDTATVTVTITGVNDDPTANDDAFDVNKEIVFNGSVFANNGSGIDSDPDTSDIFTVTEVDGASGDVGNQITLGSGAMLTLNADGTFEYDPTTSATFQALTGTDTATETFTYKIDDGNSGTDTATVTVTVSANQLPVPKDDLFATDEETPLLNLDVLVDNGNGIDIDPDGDSGNLFVAGLPSLTSSGGASLTLNLDGTIDYDPNGAFNYLQAGETTTDTFTYTLEDERGGQSLGTVTVTITGVNDDPTAVDDAFTTDENTVLNGVNVLDANPTTADSDPDTLDTLTITEVNGVAASVGNQIALASGALLTLNSDGTFSYDPNGTFESLANGQNGSDSFTYKIDDGHGGTDTATVSVTITGVNDDPVAVDDAFTTDENTSLTGGNVLNANPTTADSDVEGQAFTVTGVSGGSVGSQFALGSGALLTLNSDGTFEYDPNGAFESLADGENGSDSFTYTITDSQGGTDTATVNLTITGVNDPPVPVNDTFTTDEDTELTGGNVLAANPTTADSDPEGQALTVTGVLGGSVGSQFALGSGALLTVNSDGTFSYDPNGQFEGLAVTETDTDSFTYTITDSQGGTDSATVTIIINGVNDAPTANNDAVTTDENNSTSGDLFANNGSGIDSDPDTSDTFTVTKVNGLIASVGNPTALGSGALLTVNADGTFSYDPSGFFEWLENGENGTDSFTYTIDDGHGGTDTATVIITITGVNDDPIAVDDFFITDEDTELAGGNVLNPNDHDPENQTLTVTGITGGSVGSEFALGSGALLTLNSDGTFSYDPNGQFEGLADGQNASDSFTYTITDSQGGTDTATVTITINGVNDDPVAVDDAFTTNEDTELTGGNVLNANPTTADSDVEGQAFTVTGVTGGSVGSQFALGSGALLTLNSDGTFSYDPNGAFENLENGQNGSDSFTYTIQDSQGGTDTATVTITITGVNDAPVAVDDAFTTDEVTTLSVANLLNANPTTADSDVEGQVFTVTKVNGSTSGVSVGLVAIPSGAMLAVQPDGMMIYDPNGAFDYLADGESATDTFTYTIQDSQGGTDTATVTITINGVNTDPVAVNDAFSTDEDTALSGGNVLNANPTTADSDVEGQSFTVTEVNNVSGNVGNQFTLTSGALLTLNSDGTFDYDPNGAFEYLAVTETHVDSFSYTIEDTQGGTDTATVLITINGVNDDPTANDDAVTTDEDNSTSGDLFANNGSGIDSDPDTTDDFTVTGVSGGTVGSQFALGSGALLTVNADGTFSYDPNGAFEGLENSENATDSFTYTIDDGHGGTDTATVTVTITGVNDDPVAVDDAFTTDEDTVLNVGNVLNANPTTADSDPESQTITVTGVTGGSVGSQFALGSGALLTVNSDGTFSYDPNGSFDYLAVGESASDSFTYTISDSQSGTDTATVSITINGVNDPVIAADDDVTTSKDNTVNFDARLDNGNGPDLDADTSDVLSVFEITDTGIGTVAATVGGAITLDSGATLTLQADGTLTYDPNGQFSGLVLPTDTATDTFTYSIRDGHGSSDTATVTVTVTGSNELLELTTPLPDISSDGLSPETIDLDTHFTDPDAGDTVTYSIVSAELVGGGSLPAKFWVDNVGISGSDLNITFTDYKSDQVRLPIEIKVKAHSSDTLSPDVEDTFILSPDPQQTIDVQLIARNSVSADRDFTSFRAEGGVTSQGGARFQLVNSQQDMTYLVDLSDFFLDLDGTGTGDPNDNLSKLEIIDTANGNNVLFKIFDSATADDNPTLDTASSLLTGTWAAGEGFTSGILDKFYNGDLAVRYSSSGGVTGIVSGGNIMVSPEVDDIANLPSQINEVTEGSSYVVEIWVSDQLAQVLAAQTTETRDLVAVWLDLVWNDTSATHADFSSATGAASAFGTTDDGVIMNGAGKVDDIKGLTRIPGFGENGYARIGYVSFIADTPTPDADPIDFSVNFTPGDDSITRGTEVDLSQISINGTSVTQRGTSEFLIQTDMSNISIEGKITVDGETVTLSPQDFGLESTSVSGRLEVLFDDVNNPSTIQILDSFIDVNPSGLAVPDRIAGNNNLTAEELADFALSGVIHPGGTPTDLDVAIRDALVQVLFSQQTLNFNGNDGSFDISEDWQLTNGDLYSMTSVSPPGFGTFVNGDIKESTAGETMTYFDPVTGVPTGLTDWSHAKLTKNASGLYELLIPISRVLNFTSGPNAYPVELKLTGYATAAFKVGQETTDQYGDVFDTAEATGLSSTSTGTMTYYGGIGNNTNYSGAGDTQNPVDPLSDVDMFKIQLNAGDSVLVDVDADQFDTGLDSVLRIFNSSGTEVAYDDNNDVNLTLDEFIIGSSGAKDSYLSFTADTTDTYYIGISAFNTTDNPATYDPETTVGRATGVSADNVGSYDLTITVQNGAGPSPLYGTQSLTSDAVPQSGTSVDMVVTRNQTELDSLGQTGDLPASDTWIDEWSSFWVEIYVETADAGGVTDAAVDLNYNTDFFTATAIEFGGAFTDNGTAVIDDSTGVVTSLSGTSVFDRAGGSKKVLLARVKFESLEQDDVSIDFEDKFIGPHALGLSLSNVSVSLTDNAEANLVVGDAPDTDLWAIAYDVNDDDSIDFRDLVILASIYNQNVLDADSPYVWALDADKSGTVNFKDLTFFASNYGVHKGGNKEVVYPPNFLQRWYGQTTNISGDSSINDVMDTALGIWQDALGMDEPLDIQLVITDLGGTQLGEGQISAVDEQGRPVAGIVTLDDDAAGLGWYSDVSTTAFGGGDLEGGVSYTADMNSDAAGHYDLLTVLLHEIGHVLGFTDTYAPFESHVQAGVGGTLSFVGNGFEAKLTDDGLHLDDTVHAGDVMNATLDPGVRKLPSILDALILQTAHETAATGNFDILVGATAPLTASDVPLTGNGDSVLPEALQPLTTLAVPYTDVVSVSVSSESASSQDEGSGSSLPVVWRQVLNTLSQNLSSGSDQSDLDLTLLDGLNEEFVQTLRENGLSIVESGEIHSFDFSNLDPADWQLTGLDQDGDGGFDEVFSDWAGPIL
ncbi:sulfur oxidation protein SoxZ [Gimesia panareensis]|uniref:Sulfur oxidation protein SoxZ n=1 Tax=Gimesia panareensis TaxID=2527978 RepID=A0A518FSN3_9PLAN|nr:Ig-like domain-containing protein [Gimesia panareensis]QDV19361.1 sulfur oxidation protein SoxZ [Gimesia panareensis]